MTAKEFIKYLDELLVNYKTDSEKLKILLALKRFVVEKKYEISEDNFPYDNLITFLPEENVNKTIQEFNRLIGDYVSPIIEILDVRIQEFENTVKISTKDLTSQVDESSYGELTKRIIELASELRMDKKDSAFAKKTNQIYNRLISEGLKPKNLDVVRKTLNRYSFYSDKQKLK